MLRIMKPKRRESCRRPTERPEAAEADESWSMNFVAVKLFDECRIRLLTIINGFTRESLAIGVAGRSGNRTRPKLCGTDVEEGTNHWER